MTEEEHSMTPDDDPTAALAYQVAQLLVNPWVNPAGGSVPLEKIQNHVYDHHQEIYTVCVSNRRNAFRRYIQDHADLLRFHSSNPEHCRVSLAAVSVDEVRRRDEQFAVRSQRRAMAFVVQLVAFLSSRPDRCAPIDEIQAWASPPMARGDIVRLARRWPSRFRILGAPLYAIQMTP